MRRRFISILLALALLLALPAPAFAAALGESVDAWSAALSDGAPRTVANYILLAVPAEPTGEAAQLSLEPLHINAVAGAAVPLTVRAADENGYGAPLPDGLEFTVSDGLGTVRDGQYFAAGTGSGTITVSAPGVRGVSVPVRVTQSPESSTPRRPAWSAPSATPSRWPGTGATWRPCKSSSATR